MTIYSLAEQTGKGILFINMMQNMLGRMHYVCKDNLAGPNGYVGRFNSLFENRLLNIFDEAGNFFGDKKANQDLVRVIQQDYIQFKSEGTVPHEGPDPANCIALTNEKLTTNAKKTGCRNAMFHINEKWAMSNCTTDEDRAARRSYFRKLGDAVENQNVLSMMLWIFQNYDISEWDAQDIPQTELLDEIQEISSSSSLTDWIGAWQRLEGHSGCGHFDSDNYSNTTPDRWVSGTELHRLYKEWCRACCVPHPAHGSSVTVFTRSGIAPLLGTDITKWVNKNKTKAYSAATFYKINNLCSTNYDEQEEYLLGLRGGAATDQNDSVPDRFNLGEDPIL